MVGRLYICQVVERANPKFASRPNNPITIHAIASEKIGITRCQAIIASQSNGANRGKALYNWTLCWVEADDWTDIEADFQIKLVRLNERLNDTVSSTIKNRIINLGVISISEAVIVNTFNDLLTLIIHKHYPNVDIAQTFPALIKEVA